LIKAAAATSDRMIREELLSRLRAELGETLSAQRDRARWEQSSCGGVRSRAEKQAICLAAELTSGVRAVSDNLIVESGLSALQLAIA
jgi:hypothetical protein